MMFNGCYLPSSSSSGCLQRFKQLTLKQVTGNLVSVILGVVFAFVATVSGIITGGILGKEGLLRGAVVGGISGVVLSVEEFESFRRLLLSDEKRIECLLCLLDVIGNLVSGRLVQERIAPILFNALDSQLSATHTEPSFDIFEIGGGCKGLSAYVIQKIPEIKITTNNCFDSDGEMIPCSVCLEDFQITEQIRELPHCHHMFHTTCIDQWLMVQGSCPLCRRDL